MQIEILIEDDMAEEKQKCVCDDIKINDWTLRYFFCFSSVFFRATESPQRFETTRIACARQEIVSLLISLQSLRWNEIWSCEIISEVDVANVIKSNESLFSAIFFSFLLLL